MNARILALLTTLLVFAGAGVVLLRGHSDPAGQASSAAGRQGATTPTSPAAPRGDAGAVRPVGLMINAPTHTGKDPASDDTFGVELAFFGTFERTRLALELHYPQGGIIDLAGDSSSLTLFQDDMGGDLLKKESSFGVFEMMPRISDDGRYLVFVVPSDRLPQANATKVRAKGAVAAVVATRAQTFDAVGVKLAEGSEFSVGGYDFEITEAGDSDWGDGRSITVKTKRDTNAILRYALVGPDGEEVELSPTMSMSGMGTWNQTLDYEAGFDQATFRVEVWQDMREVEVPFDVEAGFGL